MGSRWIKSRKLLQGPDVQTTRGKRNRAILAVLLGCGLRRAEVAKLQICDFQRREEHWAVVDLICGYAPDRAAGILPVEW
jgi:site-specific recombinase XerD